ncbi:podoplanin isoform X2 [Anarhichas minor]
MNVQLLLLLALAGPFCAFTHASPTEVTKWLDAGITESAAHIVPEVTEVPEADITIITGPPATDPEAAAEVFVTEVATHGVAATAAFTEAATPAVPLITEEDVVETEASAAATAAPGLIITDPPVVETTGPTEAADVTVQPTDAAKAGTGEDVVVEDGTEEGLSSGQVVGIVIGVLLAMVIVIAVVIAVVRRMGKYS